MEEMNEVIKGLNDIGGFIAGRVGFEEAKNFLRTLDKTTSLLKKNSGLYLALEQANNVIVHLNDLLKKKDERIDQLTRYIDGFSKDAVI